MISHKILTLMVVVASALNIQAAPHRVQLVKFHPISRAQYNVIMRLTEDKPVISEGRLISNGLNRFNELRTLIADDINSGWHHLLNLTGLLTADDDQKISADKDKVEGYPLCVIKTVDLEEVQYDESDDDERDRVDERSENSNDKSEETYNQTNRDRRPVVNCVVVMKKKHKNDDNNQENYHEHDDHHSNKGRPKKRRRNKHNNVYDNNAYELNDYGRLEKPKSTLSDSTSTRMSLHSKSKVRDYSQSYYQQLLSEQEQLLPLYFDVGNPNAAYNYQYNANAYNPYASFYSSPWSYGNPFYGYPSIAAAAPSQYLKISHDSGEDSNSVEDY